MLGQMGHFEGLCSDGTHVVKNDHRPGYVAVAVVDGRGGMFDGRFKSIAACQDAVSGQADNFVVLNSHIQGISRRRTGEAVGDPKYFRERFAESFVSRPSNHLFRDSIEIADIARDIGAEHSVSNSVKRYLSQFLFGVCRAAGRATIDHASQRPSQPIAVQVILKKIVPRAAEYGLFCEVFGFRPAENQDGDLRRGRENLVECLHALAIRQNQVEQNRLDSALTQAREGAGEPNYALNVEGRGRGSERFSHHPGVRGVGLDQQYTFVDIFLAHWRPSFSVTSQGASVSKRTRSIMGRGDGWRWLFAARPHFHPDERRLEERGS